MLSYSWYVTSFELMKADDAIITMLPYQSMSVHLIFLATLAIASLLSLLILMWIQTFCNQEWWIHSKPFQRSQNSIMALDLSSLLMYSILVVLSLPSGSAHKGSYMFGGFCCTQRRWQSVHFHAPTAGIKKWSSLMVFFCCELNFTHHFLVSLN